MSDDSVDVSDLEDLEDLVNLCELCDLIKQVAEDETVGYFEHDGEGMVLIHINHLRAKLGADIEGVDDEDG